MEAIPLPTSQFIYPNIESERGEFERTALKFGIDVDTLIFLAKEEGVLQTLSKAVWDGLENTDSNRFDYGDEDAWNQVRQCSEIQKSPRDWMSLRNGLENGQIIDAPIILKIANTHYLVSGNTRLMVARALGITPNVLVFEYKEASSYPSSRTDCS